MLSCHHGAHCGSGRWDQGLLRAGALEVLSHGPRGWQEEWARIAWPVLSCSTMSPSEPACPSLGCTSVRESALTGVGHCYSPCEGLGGAFPKSLLAELEVMVTLTCVREALWPAIHEGGASHSQLDTWGARPLPSAFLFTCHGDGCVRVYECVHTGVSVCACVHE